MYTDLTSKCNLFDEKTKVLKYLFDSFNDGGNRLMIYYEHLEHLNLNDLKNAINLAIASCEKMPTIAEILNQHYKIYFDKAIKTLKKAVAIYSHYSDVVAFEDKILGEIIKRKGLKYFAYSFDFNDYWSLKNLSDEYSLIARQNISLVRHLENYNASKSDMNYLFFDYNANSCRVKDANELQLINRSDDEKNAYLLEKEQDDKLKKLMLKVAR